MKKHVLPAQEKVRESSLEQYAAHRQEICLLLNDFLLKYLNSLYAEFHGDITLAIVLGELAHQNITQAMGRGPLAPALRENSIALESIKHLLLPTNPFSISEATGIPRETVRRKFEELIRRGWAEQVSSRGYVITPQVGEHFSWEFNLSLFEGVRELCTRLETILHGKTTIAHDP